MQAIGVVINDATQHAMSLHLGNASMGTYAFERAVPTAQGCIAYYFQVTTTTGTEARVHQGPQSPWFRLNRLFQTSASMARGLLAVPIVVVVSLSDIHGRIRLPGAGFTYTLPESGAFRTYGIAGTLQIKTHGSS
jgi:hypothetical protein